MGDVVYSGSSGSQFKLACRQVQTEEESKMTNFIQRGWARTVAALTTLREERGQTFVEYVMVAGLVGVALIIGLTAFKDQIASALDAIGSQL
jgi:Flp pilus assembly pilin Flp